MENLPPGYFQVPQPIRGDGAGGWIRGHGYYEDLENPDMLVPPTTDAGLILIYDSRFQTRI